MRQIFMLFFAGLLAIQVSSATIKSLRLKVSNANPRELIDQAEEQLGELRSIVQGAISTADNNFENLEIEFLSYGDNILHNGQLDIEQQHVVAVATIQLFRGLGWIAGVDVSSCIDVREQVINRLPDQYVGEITQCILNTNTDSTKIFEESKYLVDVYINKVDQLEFQLGLCSTDSISCISSIVNEIELDMVQLLQNIRVEVDQTTDLLEKLKISAQDCSDPKVAQYSSESNSIVSDIAACVNRLIP